MLKNKAINTILFLLILIFITPLDSYAQFYFFGRNKVQHEQFDWKIIRTKHFDIYYYNELEEIAEIGAYYAEEAYDELRIEMNHIVTRRIPLIFYNTHIHFQQTNTTPGFIPEGVGGFFEFMKGRVVIPFMGNLNQFRHVIRHELVHVFMVNKIYRIHTDHRIPTGSLPPLWFVEGLAEFYSTEWDKQAEMIMRDAVLNNYFVGLNDIDRIYGTFLMYKEGQNFLEFVAEKYGRHKVFLILDNFWMSDNFNKVIEYTLGKSIREIDNEWLYFLKSKYYPLLKDQVPLQNASKKITDFGFNFSPKYFEHGREKGIFFTANRDGYASLYKLLLDDENEFKESPELIVRGEMDEELEAFHLLSSAIDISSDGKIAFVTKSGATDVIHFYSLDDKKIVHTMQRDYLISISGPSFSPDGKLVVFQAIDQKGFSDIFIYNVENENIVRLVNDYYDDKNPIFSPDGSSIIFSSNRTAGIYEKKYNIFSINIDSRKISYLTYLNADSEFPVLTPDKNKLIFTSDVKGVNNLWQINFNENLLPNTIYQLTDFTTSIFHATHINEDRIVLSGFENFSFNLYDYKVDNTFFSSIIDSVEMDFTTAHGRWEAGKISAVAELKKADYEKEYTLDYAQSQISTDPVFGTRGGALLSLSDLLGDDNYLFLIYNTAEVQSDFLKSFNVLVSRLYLGDRANYNYGIFHFSGRRYDIRDSDEFFFERSFGGSFAMHFPISKFSRIETNVSLVNSDKQVLTGVIERKALLLSNTISYVGDNSLWGPTGPLDGRRYRLMLGYTSDIKYSNVNYFTVIADYRDYLRLGFRTSVGFRAAMFYNEGKEARRYFMGGSWDLRGWNRWSIRGEKLWLTSLEFRFPMIDEVRVRFPFINLGLFHIRGALFFDMGGAWDTKYKETLGSIGAGIRLNLFNIVVFRYDIGKKIENHFSRLQEKWFYQFFFGWDF